MQKQVKQTKRAVELEDDRTSKVSEKNKELEQMIVTVHLLNEAKNKADREYKAARATLLKTMKDSKLITKQAAFKNGKGEVLFTLEAIVAASEGFAADVVKLFDIVGKKKFMEIVSASKAAIEQHVGLAVFEQVKTPTTGEENVSVKKLKAE